MAEVVDSSTVTNDSAAPKEDANENQSENLQPRRDSPLLLPNHLDGEEDSATTTTTTTALEEANEGAQQVDTSRPKRTVAELGRVESTSTNSATSVQTVVAAGGGAASASTAETTTAVVAKSDSRPVTSKDRPVSEEVNQSQQPTSSPMVDQPTKEKKAQSPAPMKRFNNLLPKFKSNKLEPLNVDPSAASGASGSGSGATTGTKSRSGPKNKKLKGANGKNRDRSNRKSGKESKQEAATAQQLQQSAPAQQPSQPINEPSTSAQNIVVPGTSATTAEIGTIPNGADMATPTIQVVEVDADQLRRTSKVIFAVPQFPGQPLIPIAYKITNRRPSNLKPNDGQNGYQPSNLMMNDMHFEVVWRNLIYYHQSNVKQLKEAAKKDAAAKSGQAKSGQNSKSKNKAGAAPPPTKSGKKKGADGAKSKGSKGVSPQPPPKEAISESRLSIPRNGQPRPTLNNISGSFQSGQMTAIMGPSGAGKTVFLNCITGHLSINSRKENSGDILINGVRSIRIGFVEQFDHLLPHLTVRETLLFASRIKNAARYYLNHIKIVDNVISRLDLVDCSESYASRCSNGQRKRLSIAIELCFNSDILILDEPTTGLDAVTGFQIMNTLKALSKRRRAISILATIHQPSPRMFELFDNLVVLSREGTIMYQGSPQDLPQTLLLVGLSAPMYSNISDFLLEVASGDFGRQSLHLLAHYNMEYNKTRIAEDLSEVEVTSLQEAVRRANQINKRSFVLCTWLLFIRTIVCNWRNPFNTQIRIVSLIFCSIFLSLVFTDVVGTVSTCPPTKYFLWRFQMDNILEETERQQMHVQENLAVIFMLALVSLFNSMLNIVVTFPEEIAVFRREYDNYSYSIFSFYIAKILGDLPFTFPTTAVFVTVVHRMTGQIFDEWSRLYLAILPCCAVTFIGQLIGMTIGVIFCYDIKASVYSVILIIIPLIMFSGYFRLISDMSWFMAQLSWVSFLKQVVNSLMIALYGFGRCEHEDALEREAFFARNVSEADARPSWINSLTTLIDYQLTLSESQDPSMLAIKNKSLEPEDKLVRYMGLNIGTDPMNAKRPLVLQHFDLEPSSEAYWHELYIMLDYIVLFAAVLYLVMVIKFTRKN